MSNKWISDILDFWFAELSADDWFSGEKRIDEMIRSRFSGIYEQLAENVPDIAWTDPRAALAAIVALDQFPRNIFRGTAKAFAADHLAAALSRNALERGFDRGLTRDQWKFMAMPLMHSEVMDDQRRCVEIFEAIGDPEALKYALEHHDIVEKFGRFPHRNRALGRETSDAEHAFMEGHAGYGQ